MEFLLFTTATFLFLFFGWFAIVSMIEKEKKATQRAIVLLLLCPLPFFVPILFPSPVTHLAGIILLLFLGIAVFVLMLPIRHKKMNVNEVPNNRFDERDTMFSRNEITRRPELQETYYQNNPENATSDKQWLKKPGLMSEESAFYSPATFTAANASFFPIEQLRPFVDGQIQATKKEFKKDELSLFITNWAKKLGAVSVGFCEMKDYHFYSVRGRGKAYGDKVRPNHQYGIAITVEMDKEWLASGPAGPTLMESARQYLNSGTIAIQIAKFIRDLGFEARAHVDGNYEVICPVVARDAGLGEIGRMGLLMTPELGPRVRIAVVSTNIPLKITKRKPDHSIYHFCTICKKCADLCPGNAISKGNIEFDGDTHRWQLSHEKCFAYWCTSGTDCGRCMSVCPYSHPNNLLHNLVRWGIRNNKLFAHLALRMDDFFYGRKPKPAKVPKWMDIKPKDNLN